MLAADPDDAGVVHELRQDDHVLRRLHDLTKVLKHRIRHQRRRGA
jgi:hypothetical protein